MQKANKTKIEQNFHQGCKIHRARCNPCFRNHFLEKQTDHKERDSSYLMDERGEIGLDEQKTVERSIFFFFFFFHFLTPILLFLWKIEILHIQGFREPSTIIVLVVRYVSQWLPYRLWLRSLSLSLCFNLLWKAGYFYFVWFFIVRSSESWLGVALNWVCWGKIGWARTLSSINIVSKLCYKYNTVSIRMI